MCILSVFENVLKNFKYIIKYDYCVAKYSGI